MSDQRFSPQFPVFLLGQKSRNQDTGAPRIENAIIDEITLPTGSVINCLPLFSGRQHAVDTLNAAFKPVEAMRLTHMECETHAALVNLLEGFRKKGAASHVSIGVNQPPKPLLLWSIPQAIKDLMESEDYTQ